MRREPYRANKDIIAVLRICVVQLFCSSQKKYEIEKRVCLYIVAAFTKRKKLKKINKSVYR